MDPCRSSSFFVNYAHPAVASFAQAHRGPSASPRDIAISLYYAIRDGFYYSPWNVALQPDGFRASAVVTREPKVGHCIDKAMLLVACCRRLDIPARFHFANVRNHIGTAALERQLGTDLLVFHGYCEIQLEERWVAATPAFNRELCEKLGVDPLEFDGTEDSIFQQYDRNGGLFMEYVHDYGWFADLPFEQMLAEWRTHYKGVDRDGRWPRPPDPSD